MTTNQIHTCSHCGNLTNLTLIKEISVEEDFYGLENEYETVVYNIYYLFKCISCCRVSIYAQLYTNQEKPINELELVFPKVRNIKNLLPDKVKNTYVEAKRIQNISSTAFMILIRKSLEQICVDQNANGKNLYEKILKLSDKGIIPKKIMNLASLIRHIGNISSHENDLIDVWDVEIVDEFFHIIAEYIYSLDNQISIIKKKWELP